jgi:hypothetical protein
LSSKKKCHIITVEKILFVNCARGKLLVENGDAKNKFNNDRYTNDSMFLHVYIHSDYAVHSTQTKSEIMIKKKVKCEVNGRKKECSFVTTQIENINWRYFFITYNNHDIVGL